MHWDSLELYFLSNFDLDNDPIENDPDEKTSRVKRLVSAVKQPVSKLYVMFVQSVLPIFDNFNTFLQGEKPLIHILYHCILRLYGYYFQDLSYLKLCQNQMMC